jgi:hypothetical protein
VGNIYLVTATTVLLAGCASVAPYQAPLPGEASASLFIEFGVETGEVQISYGKSDSGDCFEFSNLYKTKNSISGNEKKRPAKQVTIPANGPQVLRYNRVDYNEYCDINLRFMPQQGKQYLLRTDSRYLKPESELPAFFGGGAKSQCIVELFRKDAGDVLSPVKFDKLPIKPTRIGYPGCPKILTQMRSFFLVGSRRQFDLDTSGTMRHISSAD